MWIFRTDSELGGQAIKRLHTKYFKVTISYSYKNNASQSFNRVHVRNSKYGVRVSREVMNGIRKVAPLDFLVPHVCVCVEYRIVGE
jgi:hypothetical protein